MKIYIYTLGLLMFTLTHAETLKVHCTSQDGLTATLSLEYEHAAGGNRYSLESIDVTYQTSDVLSQTVQIPVTRIFDSVDDMKAYIQKETGAAFSHIFYETRPELKNDTLTVPSRALVYSGARNTLQIVGLVDSAEYFYRECK